MWTTEFASTKSHFIMMLFKHRSSFASSARATRPICVLRVQEDFVGVHIFRNPEVQVKGARAPTQKRFVG